MLIPLTRLYPRVDLFGLHLATEGLRTALVSMGCRTEFPIVLFMLPSLGLFAFKLRADLDALPRSRRLRAAATGYAQHLVAWR